MAMISGTQFNDNGSQKPKLNGSIFDDEIYGFGGNDWLNGFGGNDLLNGGSGADQMYGGQGDDTYVVDNVGDQVFESANEGYDTVKASVNYTLTSNVENLTLTGTTALNGTGNASNNHLLGNSNNNTLAGLDGHDFLDGGAAQDTLMGGSGNDTLWGGTGSDVMFGGTGDDKYYVDAVTDEASEIFGNGYDTVISTVSYTLGSGIEKLSIDSVGNANGTGNALDNFISNYQSYSGNNTFSGLGGNDYLSSGRGNDILLGGTGNDTLVGADLDNAGKGEIDTLTGGTGADRFVLGEARYGEFPSKTRFYNDGQANTLGQTDYALITDFNATEDKIQLAGSKSDYLLSNVSFSGVSGTGVYIKGSQPGSNELIGVVQNVAANNLSLDSSSFSFV